jgi:dCMP deaminase
MNERPTWDETWLEKCEVLAKRSTCWKRQTATIIVDENQRQVSEGYNGTPAGEMHCCDYPVRNSIEHREWSKVHEIHAEMNALLYLARYPRIYAPERATLYTLLSPCTECAKAIYTVGIGRVVVRNVHKTEGMSYLSQRGVVVEYVDPRT